MDSMLIRELQSYAEENYKIRVRVCRLWRGKRIHPERNDGLHCVLVDERGDAIHGIVSEANYSSVSGKLKQGEVYLISDFYVRDSQEDYKVVDNSIQAHFNGKTKFKLLHNSFPQIPQHRFYLLEYNQLQDRIDKTDLLTDLFGCVKSIMPIEEVNTRDGPESKCEITLQNLRREQIRVTLWGNSARKVDIETIESLPPPVLMVITSLKVRQYKEMPAPSNTSHTSIFINPEIPQAEPYKIEFSKATDTIKKLPPPCKQLTAAEVEKQDKTTVHQLNRLNPQKYKNQLVYCEAFISRFSTHDGWWYEACPQCYKQLTVKKNSDLRVCLDHSMQIPLPCYRMHATIEDPNSEATIKLKGKPAEQLFGITCRELIDRYPYAPQETLPQEILQTTGQIHIFQIQISEANDFIVKGVFPSTKNQPSASTPAHPLYDRKRSVDKGRRQLFATNPDKKPRREGSTESATSSTDTRNKEKRD
ncbi:hypothetical protein ABKV19_026384 [Rosa sericea]